VRQQPHDGEAIAQEDFHQAPLSFDRSGPLACHRLVRVESGKGGVPDQPLGRGKVFTGEDRKKHLIFQGDRSWPQ